MERLTGLILKHAQSFMAQGRSSPLDTWIGSLPVEFVESMPWLLYWKGISRFAMNPAESLIHLKKAYQLFQAQKDVAGVFMAWSGVVNSVLYSYEDMHRVDEWVDVYETFARFEPQIPPEIAARAASSMLTALMFRQPWRTDLDVWLDKALLSTDNNMKIQALFHYIFHLGNVGGFGKARHAAQVLHHLTDRREIAPFHRLIAHLFGSTYQIFAGNYESCRNAVYEGLKLADESGVHLLDLSILGAGVHAAYNYGDLSTANELLSRLLPDPTGLRLWDRIHHYHLHALKSFFEGDFRQALSFNEQALAIARKFGDPNSPFICGILHTHLLYELGEVDRAKEFLDQMIEPWRRDSRSHDSFLYHLTKAYLYLDDDRKRALDCLVKGLSIGKEEQLVATYYPWQPAAIGRLFSFALEQGIEVDYVQELIRKQNLVLETPPLHIEHWPWPVKIFTLGGLRIERDGKRLSRTVRFSGKTARKPLELLMLLVAIGEGNANSERVADVLWPDAEGDAGRKSLGVTLLRLRDLLGSRDAVLYENGIVRLNERIVWTDVRAFEKLLENAECGMRSAEWKRQNAKNQDRGNPMTHFERAFALYRGSFLEGENAHWAIPRRERLREIFVKAVAAEGRRLEETGAWDRAIGLYQSGLEADELVEQFYTGLMSCYRKLGRPAEALSAYRHCKRVFDSYQVPPSARIEEERRAIQLKK